MKEVLSWLAVGVSLILGPLTQECVIMKAVLQVGHSFEAHDHFVTGKSNICRHVILCENNGNFIMKELSYRVYCRRR